MDQGRAVQIATGSVTEIHDNNDIMFTGIIETLGTVELIEPKEKNMNIWISSSIAHELKIDQSVSHNGVCLTVIDIQGEKHCVTAIDETLKKSNLANLQVGQQVNLERCMPANGRFDGHIVQGHVDQTGEIISIQENAGSWVFRIQYEMGSGNLTVEKGSITVNGVSLTVFDSQDDAFSLAIIPYTYQHTNFKQLQVGTIVNLEFDIVGKYIARLIQRRI